ncbi:zinc metalloprotease HtpX [Halobacteriales archaeon QS_8_69_26]|nr:MAG: zinc metalloprotease HtpX [Halobacteriales archaeon QS_8_69_26]
MRVTADWGLRLRMAATLAGLGVLYLGLVAALAKATGSTVLVVAGAGLAVAAQYRYADRIALRATGAERVDPAAYPDLHARLVRLSRTAGVPAPDLAVVDSPDRNAFAAGRSRESAVVCVTTGLLDALDGEELDAVLAHELAHVAHRDATVLTLVSALSTVAYAVVRHVWWFGDGGDGGSSGGESGVPWLLVAVLVSLVVWAGSYVLIRALSRYREYAADRGAALITGDPAALAAALETLAAEDEDEDDRPEEDLRAGAGMNALYAVPGGSRFDVPEIMRTHPPTERRVERLRSMERDLSA